VLRGRFLIDGRAAIVTAAIGRAESSGRVLPRPACVPPSRADRLKETTMARGSKDSYTDKQKRQAEHIEEGYEERGVPEDEAERRAWATVNKDDGGGKKSGSGRGAHTGHPASHKGGKS
jgi:hypothetical protein